MTTPAVRPSVLDYVTRSIVKKVPEVNTENNAKLNSPQSRVEREKEAYAISSWHEDPTTS